MLRSYKPSRMQQTIKESSVSLQVKIYINKSYQYVYISKFWKKKLFKNCFSSNFKHHKVGEFGTVCENARKVYLKYLVFHHRTKPCNSLVWKIREMWDYYIISRNALVWNVMKLNFCLSDTFSWVREISVTGKQ